MIVARLLRGVQRQRFHIDPGVPSTDGAFSKSSDVAAVQLDLRAVLSRCLELGD